MWHGHPAQSFSPLSAPPSESLSQLDPQGHRKGQQKEAEMAHWKFHLSKGGNFGREQSIKRAEKVVSEGVAGGVVRGAAGSMECLDESRNNDLVPVRHLLSLEN